MVLRGFHLHEDPSPKFCCSYWRKYPFKNHLRPKSCTTSFIHRIIFSYPIICKFCTEHGSTTAVLCAKFQNDRTTEITAMIKRNHTHIAFQTDFIILLQPLGLWFPAGADLIVAIIDGQTMSEWLTGSRDMGIYYANRIIRFGFFSTPYDKKVIPWPVINSMVPGTV